jgi:hypothetical protein
MTQSKNPAERSRKAHQLIQAIKEKERGEA